MMNFNITARGWYEHILRLQAENNTGIIGKIWPDLSDNSAWLGGNGEHWERGPYYLDGLIPLSYLIDDDNLKELRMKWIDEIISSQRSDGDFGPAECTDIWPKMVALKALFQEWNYSNSEKLTIFFKNCFPFLKSWFEANNLSGWGRARGYELILFLKQYSESSFCQDSMSSIISLAKTIREMTFDWTSFFADSTIRKTTFVSHPWNPEESTLEERINSDWFISTHAVNVSMALKCFMLNDWIDGTECKKTGLKHALDTLRLYHASGDGFWTGSEHLAGSSPSQGTELCSVVEALYSLEQSVTSLPEDNWLIDVLEEVAFNVLPVSFSYDMAVHQYLHQANQISATRAHRHWYNNGDDSNIFGLEPNFGCCTANQHQGYPKLSSSVLYSAGQNILYCGMYLPCEIILEAKESVIRIVESTDYPFSGKVYFSFCLSSSVDFEFSLRIPSWCKEPLCSVNGQPIRKERDCFRIQRQWRNGDSVSLKLPFSTYIKEYPGGGVSLFVGPIQMCLPLQEKWTKLYDRGLFSDYEIRTASKWNYAIIQGKKELQIIYDDKTGLTYPSLKIKACECINWREEENSASPCPEKPVTTGKQIDLVLQPYCLSRLHIAVFPYQREGENYENQS